MTSQRPNRHALLGISASASTGIEIGYLVVEVCTRRLRGFTTLSRDEMRIAGYPDTTPEIDVCAGIQ
jgi:hypothetical protein